jgi:hypothetical protein
MTRHAPFFGLFLVLLVSCKPEGAVPAYLQLGATQVVSEGGQPVSSKITDIWVYLNDQPVGVWEPGSRVPLIGEGPSRLKLVAGVRKDGITDQRIQYPYYATWEQQVQLVPEQTVTVAPVFQYYPELDQWLADLETGVRFDTLDCTATMTTVASDGTLVGSGARIGRIELDAAHPLYRGVSSGDPFYGVPVDAFLEVDYRSSTPVLFGARYAQSGVPTMVAYANAVPTAQGDGSMPWNKIYLNLGSPMSVLGVSDKRIYLQAELPAGAGSAVVELDNIKLVWR